MRDGQIVRAWFINTSSSHHTIHAPQVSSSSTRSPSHHPNYRVLGVEMPSHNTSGSSFFRLVLELRVQSHDEYKTIQKTQTTPDGRAMHARWNFNKYSRKMRTSSEKHSYAKARPAFDGILWKKRLHNLHVDPSLHALSWDQPLHLDGLSP